MLRSIPSSILRCGQTESDRQTVCVHRPVRWPRRANWNPRAIPSPDRLHIKPPRSPHSATHPRTRPRLRSGEGQKQSRRPVRGIGPTYSDKAARVGLRVGDIEGDFLTKYSSAEGTPPAFALRHRLHGLRHHGRRTRKTRYRLSAPLPITDTESKSTKPSQRSKNVLAEGAQVRCSTSTTAPILSFRRRRPRSAGVCLRLGVAPQASAACGSIFKAYSTRVGSGPFRLSFSTKRARRFRRVGREFRAVTGRNRRCGWVDLVALRYRS